MGSHERRRGLIRSDFAPPQNILKPACGTTSGAIGEHISSTTLWFGALSPPSTKRRPLSPNTWTCVGALAIPLWASWPSLAIRTLDIPPFESLAIMFFFGWLVFSQLHQPEQPRTIMAAIMDAGCRVRPRPGRRRRLLYPGHPPHTGSSGSLPRSSPLPLGIDRQSTWKCSSPLNRIDPASGVSSMEPGAALGISKKSSSGSE
jgi:hypothetical protein